MHIALLIYKQRDPVPNKKNTVASNFHHGKYIATRPRVMKNELSNHGLFGNAATGDIAAIESLHKMQRLHLSIRISCILSKSLESSIKLGVEYMKMEDFEVDQYITDSEKIIGQSEGL